MIYGRSTFAKKSVTLPISLSPVNFFNEVLKFNNFLFPHQTEKIGKVYLSFPDTLLSRFRSNFFPKKFGQPQEFAKGAFGNGNKDTSPNW